MTTTTTTAEQNLESLKKGLNFLSRVIRDLQPEDFEAADAMERTTRGTI